MIIAQVGKFNLCTSVYLDSSKEISNHQLVISCSDEDDIYSQMTFIAQFNKDGELCSIHDRLFDEIRSYEDVRNIRVLEEIGRLIILETDPIII